MKGKFTELLENEIKVLRTCNNDNIIKLYDIKKTANNIYLIMEYCNEGELTCIFFFNWLILIIIIIIKKK